MIPENVIQELSQHPTYSEWLTIDQDMINEFATVTDDQQYIHVDEVAAANSPFGGTIAHGFLILSAMPRLIQPILNPLIANGTMLNYGCNKMRFLAPVKSGKRVRISLKLMGVEEKKTGTILKQEVIFEIENEPDPALVCEWLSLYIPPSPSSN